VPTNKKWARNGAGEAVAQGAMKADFEKRERDEAGGEE